MTCIALKSKIVSLATSQGADLVGVAGVKVYATVSSIMAATLLRG